LNSVNNWDLVDTSAPHIVGDYLYNNPEKSNILSEFSHSENLWVRRISIVSTFAFIKNNEFNKTLEIAKLLLHDDHDLIHKAVGWMLREIYKRDEGLIKRFLRQNYAQIPRTTLRYAIERMDKEESLLYLKGNFDVSH
jgi:3-methyladenine DNA glycosylase AlkD